MSNSNVALFEQEQDELYSNVGAADAFGMAAHPSFMLAAVWQKMQGLAAEKQTETMVVQHA